MPGPPHTHSKCTQHQLKQHMYALPPPERSAPWTKSRLCRGCRQNTALLPAVTCPVMSTALFVPALQTSKRIPATFVPSFIACTHRQHMHCCGYDTPQHRLTQQKDACECGAIRIKKTSMSVSKHTLCLLRVNAFNVHRMQPCALPTSSITIRHILLTCN
jgi:hypothetical protein